MLDAIAVQILMRAVDFLFVESTKILEERKGRGLTQASKIDSIGSVLEDNSPKRSEDIINSKENALQAKINETAWKSFESQIKSLLLEKDIHIKNYHYIRNQIADLGVALTPPGLINQRDHEETEINKITEELQVILSQVYGKRVVALEEAASNED
jgi:hypothetical protein